MTPKEQAELAVTTLDEHKGLDISQIDVTGLTDVADYIVVCTATSTRHAQTLADKVTRQLREHGVRALSTEGVIENDPWVLVDFGDLILHIMLAEAREFYSIEELWSKTRSNRKDNVHRTEG